MMVAIAPSDFQVHDTYFVVAHLHCTLSGGIVLPLMAGAYCFYLFIRKNADVLRLGHWTF